MKYLQMLTRRIEWLVLFSYAIIVALEIFVLRNLRNSPEANVIRYVTFFGVIFLSLLVIRQQIIKPIQEMRAASLRIAEGNYHERLPAYRSIELNELAQAFNQMVQKIEATEERRIELIGNVAHELRTPLGNVKITMEGLIDNLLPADSTTFFGIQREVSRLQRLVFQLETLSRAESNQIPLNRELVDLGALIIEVADRLEVQFEDKDVALETLLAPDLPTIWADPDRMTQILINLLGNALQYTPAAGRVTVTANYDSEALTVSVADTGIGLLPDDCTRIFERFYRVDKSRARSSGGNGIGLTITKHLVLAHGGRIWAGSQGIGHGTTVTFTLPLDT